MSNRAEFQDAGCLLISEVHLFFSRPGESEKGLSAYVQTHSHHSVTQKTKEYVDEFSRYKDQSTIREVRAYVQIHLQQPFD